MRVTKKNLAIIDYGVGNHTSVLRSIRQSGFRAIVTSDIDRLDEADVLLLPGVGAFPLAMEYLHKYDLVSYLHSAVNRGKPLIGICLGMQLLAESSTELGFTEGLGLIPGVVEAIKDHASPWHIGWNTLEVSENFPSIKSWDGESMFFNHSFTYRGPHEYVAIRSRIRQDGFPIVSAIHRGSVWGLQFHPEKSQRSGLKLLSQLIRSTGNV